MKKIFLFIFFVSVLFLAPDNFSLAASVSLTAQPSSGTAPLQTTIIANVIGAPQGTLTYYFWWDCNNPSREINPTSLYPGCGYLNDPSKGELRVDVNYATGAVLHTYDCSQPNCEYTAKVIVLGASLAVESQTLIKVSSPQAAETPEVLGEGTVDQAQAKIDYCVNYIRGICSSGGGCPAGSQNNYINSCGEEVKVVFRENLNDEEKKEVARITENYFKVQPSQPGAPGTPGVPGAPGAPASPGAPCDPNSNQLCNPLQAENFGELINIIINFLFWIAIVAGPAMILVAAFMYLTSGGNMAKLATAKNIIIYTAVGIAVALFAKGFISIIKGVFNG